MPSSSSKRQRNEQNGIDIDLYHVDHHRANQLKAEADPVGFSYYVASNLVLSADKLQSILEASDVISRLRMIIFLLKESESMRMIACSVCGQNLAPKTELFNVPGAEGIAGAYVNRHG